MIGHACNEVYDKESQREKRGDGMFRKANIINSFSRTLPIFFQ